VLIELSCQLTVTAYGLFDITTKSFTIATITLSYYIKHFTSAQTSCQIQRDRPSRGWSLSLSL